MPLTPEFVSAVGDVIGAIAALAAVVIASREIGRTVKALKLSALGNLLQIEADVAARRQRVEDILHNMAECRDSDKQKHGLLKGHCRTAVENYMNGLDRIAFCIRKGYLPEREFRNDYEQLFRDFLKGVKKLEPEVDVNEQYDNITALLKKWDSRPRYHRGGARNGN